MSYSLPGLTELFQRFGNLRQAPTGDGKRMPHKPLLILLMLGRARRGDLQAVPFQILRGELEELLARFGPRSSPNALDPFWRLQNDEGHIWEVRDRKGSRISDSISPPGIRNLEDAGATGSFSKDLRDAFRLRPHYAVALGNQLLMTNFPESLHGDIASAVGLNLEDRDAPGPVTQTFSRDPGFRTRVLTAYEYRCAITGWDLRLGNISAGIEAAHIRWHVAGGPCEERNGIAINALHHKLFDLGIFTLSVDDRIPRVLVSRLANGGDAVGQFLMQFHRQPIRLPQDPAWMPDREFVEWHQREVFKGEPRV